MTESPSKEMALYPIKDVTSTIDVRVGTFQMIWNEYLDAEQKLPLSKKLSYCFKRTFCSCRSLEYILQPQDSLRYPALRAVLFTFVFAVIDNIQLFYGFQSLVTQNKSEAISAWIGIANIIARIILSLYFMSRFPISIMIFSTFPILNLWTSIKNTTTIYTDLNSSFTKEYDGFRYYWALSMTSLLNIPFLIAGCVVAYVLGVEPSCSYNICVTSEVLQGLSIFSIITAVYAALSNFCRSMSYHMAGCEEYEDFWGFSSR